MGVAAGKRLGWTFIQLHDNMDNNNSDGWIHPDEFKKRYMMIKNKEKLDKIQHLNALKLEKQTSSKTYDDRLNKAMMIKKMQMNQDKEENDDFSDDEDDNLKQLIFGDNIEQNENNLAVYSDDDNNSFGWSTQDADDEIDHNNNNDHEKKNEADMSWEDLIGLYRIPELRDKEIYQHELEKELDLKPFIFNEIYLKAKNRKHVADLKCLIRLKKKMMMMCC